ncbi:exodeoxyribonuclease V subunit gamma [Egicoccus halophilus]|uniref:RecBCD enzyme subunit RecC n=1 Tax=Egicoccus halophilus TaxID=1670830 RepID=A0A8J3A8Z5_9ACTN|nr:exodeoxyribonuclease V subunit gamma [Egicoccus halophilus]GGI06989.1 RecBCD enzyme subunit RecC [Egicoccus halophilus]
MGLQVWRSERADGLVRPLAELLATPPADPFERDVVAVPTAGIERWIAQELSLRLGAAAGATDGICANVDFPFPGTLVTMALEATGELPDDADPWRPDRLVWPLLELAETDPKADCWGPARSHLESARDGRRFSAARRLVDLFDRYAVHRPEMVLDWADGHDVGPDGAAIADRHAWQPQLWRRLRERVDTPSSAERLTDVAVRLEAGDVQLDLPQRLSIFGLSALPASYLRVLMALATTRDVHLFLRHPSPALWDRIRDVHATTTPPRGPRRTDATADTPQHPLLRSWGRDAREMQTVFAALGAPDADHRPVPEPPTTLLGRIQADLRADRPAVRVPTAGDRRPLLAAGDDSLQVHAAHGRMRQVQVLRDTVLHLLADDERLEPRDIIVMCPDVEAFAPLVDAVFSTEVATSSGSTTPLRVRIADRSLRQTNPTLKVVAQLLDLADARLTGAQVLDLLAREPVRRRFRFDAQELERIEGWLPELGIRWGIDAEDRVRFDLDGVDVNTWRSGLRRLLTGIVMADEDHRLVAGILPFDDVEGSDVELAGRFAECVERLTAAVCELRDPRPLGAWRDTILAVTDRLTATGTPDRWQRLQLHRVLDELTDAARTAADATGEGTAAPVELSLAEVRVLLGDRLRGRPSRASHRTGDLTVSTLVPMRAVPHRVVCLLGMDDGAFPRRTVADGDDLIELEPFVGDRDARTEDRQLLLDALLSATDHLVITYSGRDERTNEPLPPAVPVGELLDVVDATVRSPEGRARDAVVVEHPLQPFDVRNFTHGEVRGEQPWSFDASALAGATARAGGLADPRPFLPQPLPTPDRDVLDLTSLIRFVEHPTRAFLADRLGVWLRQADDAPEDGIPLDVAGLAKWQIGDRLLTALLQGHRREQWEPVERARGTLPPEPLASQLLDEVCPAAEAIAEASRDLLGDGEVSAIDIDVRLDDGRRLVGTVGGIRGTTIGDVTFSGLKGKARLAAYVRLLALTLTHPETAWEALVVAQCKDKTKNTVEWSRLTTRGNDASARHAWATASLVILLDLYDRGMRAPAPLYPGLSPALAEAAAGGKQPWSASKAWETTYPTYPQDDLDPCHVAVLGGIASFAELLADPPLDDETGHPWPECEERVVAWARRLWEPVLEVETKGKQ